MVQEDYDMNSFIDFLKQHLSFNKSEEHSSLSSKFLANMKINSKSAWEKLKKVNEVSLKKIHAVILKNNAQMTT